MNESLDDIDGSIGEAWSGEVPNGSHINVVIARRGSPTAAAAATAFAVPGPGHAPVLCCLGAGFAVRPPTIVLNKATATEPTHSLITWGAAQLGIGQGVLDAVADGVIEATGDLYVLVAVWVDERADNETAVREANRAAVRKAIGVCVDGRDPVAAARLVDERDALRNPFYSGE